MITREETTKRKTYIRDNISSMADKEIAANLGVSSATIYLTRKEMGYPPTRGKAVVKEESKIVRPKAVYSNPDYSFKNLN